MLMPRNQSAPKARERLAGRQVVHPYLEIHCTIAVREFDLFLTHWDSSLGRCEVEDIYVPTRRHLPRFLLPLRPPRLLPVAASHALTWPRRTLSSLRCA